MIAATAIATGIMTAASGMNTVIADSAVMTAIVIATAIMIAADMDAAITARAAINTRAAGANAATGISAANRPWSRYGSAQTVVVAAMSSAGHAGWYVISTGMIAGTIAATIETKNPGFHA